MAEMWRRNLDYLQNDSLLYSRIKDQHDQPYFQKTITLREWEHTWQMEFNPSKCSSIYIKLNRQRKVQISSYFLHGQTLEATSASKYLGITISSDLSWSTHVKNVAARGNQRVGILQRNFRESTPKVSWRPTLRYAPHWSMPHLSGVPINTMTSNCWKKFNTKQPGTWPTTTWTDHQEVSHPMIHAPKSQMDKSWTMKMTDSPRDALQNQQHPCGRKHRMFLPPLWP